ncbi:MAG: hypothetical protein M3424_05070, partial [Actinomycetota bacterium]|nr:hypothetical protein [Actinomycetota bacterium]
MANIGLGQQRKDGYAETRLVTLGQDLTGARELISRYVAGWSAQQAVEWLVARVPAAQLRRVRAIA